MFTMKWSPVAADELAAILLQLPDAEADETEAAALALGQRLAADPFSEGESRSGTDRVAFARPHLTVYVTVDEVRRVVEAVHVRRR